MTDVTSIAPTQMLSGCVVRPDRDVLGLEEEFSVLTVDRCGPCGGEGDHRTYRSGRAVP